MPSQHEPRTLVDNLQFGEGPRYRDGRFWISDQHARRVLTVDLSGNTEEVVSVVAGPSGLGWLPDGTLLVVSMHDRRVLALRDGRLFRHADLSSIATGHCNDMVVDGLGRAYVGNFGFDMDGGADLVPAKLALLSPEGAVQVVAEDLLFPNGMVITPDGGTLIVAETYGLRLTAFDVAADGSLSGRRVFAELGFPPDGICLDDRGHVWVSHPVPPGGFYRIAEGGTQLERIDTGEFCGIACMLGGPEGRSLCLVEAKTFNPRETRTGNCRVRLLEVEAPGAGFPGWR